MPCCKRQRRIELVNQPSFEENELELDVISRVSTEPTESAKPEEEVDPDSLPTFQVATAIVMLVIFAISFATSFCFLTTAKDSLKSNFSDKNYTCKVTEIDEHEITCLGTDENSPCVDIRLECEGFGNRTLVLYEYYHDYYSSTKCSTTRCMYPDNVRLNHTSQEKYKFPLSLIQRCCTLNGTSATKTAYPADLSEDELYADTPFVSNSSFQYDRNKPDSIFYQRNNPGTTSLVLSRPVSYIILVLPQLLMVLILLIGFVLFMNNKLIGKEIYRPVTTITPMHLQVNGKWYIKEVKQDVQMNAFEKLRAAQNNS